jgi:alpha-mannosidase
MYMIHERIKKIVEVLGRYRYPDSESIGYFKYKEGKFNSIEEAQIASGEWLDFGPDCRWGGRDKHYWFKTQVEIPSRFQGKTVIFEVKTGREDKWDATNPQFLIYVNDKLIQGLDTNHTYVILSEEAAAQDNYSVELNAYTGMEGGLVDLKAGLVVLDREVEKLYYNIKVPLEIAVLLDINDKRRGDILNYLNEAVNLLDLRKPFSESFNESVCESNRFLEEEFYNKYCGCEDVIATCVGHTHIDVAWLWTVSQTREKSARSFSTVLSLMEQYPEYIFMSSQPQLYKFVKEDYPEVYERIKERVKEGRWEAEGAMWLEADCNLTSGESLVRQVLFGTRFFEKEFGIKNKILWLPDVFGYSAALPQILKKSGIDYFMTTKISWNEYNKMPYDTFMWKGLDGTEILTHFITASDYQNPITSHFTTYNGKLKPDEVMGTWQRYQHKDMNNDVLISFGHGDGGGGTTIEMLENARRMEKGIPGCPKVKLGNTLDYFKGLEQKVRSNRKLPKWAGELYLEYHRGTYTSMARNKRYNRKSEFLYQDVELLSTISSLMTEDGQYEQDKINEGWEGILLNQFHDILPGSSIKEVYEDSEKHYIDIMKEGNRLADNAMKSIAANITLSETSVVVFNQLGFDRSDVVEFKLPEGCENAEVYDYLGNAVLSQKLDGNKVLFFAENIPAKGYKAFKLVKAKAEPLKKQAAVQISSLGNKFFDISFDADYNITSIFDKVNDRELLKSGERANVLQAFEDRPHNFDAWDINIYYQEKMWEVNDVLSAALIENGPLRTTLRIERRFLDSTITQDIHMYEAISRIDFSNYVDWKERHILLKAAFPVDIHADKATYDVQYGNVERPTHWNTSWDYARFEVCAHKWVDLSEDDYGVSLLNDCKYGHDIKDGVMRMTLLKSATDPNQDADLGEHRFTYSLYPHSGDWKKAGTIPMSYKINCPMYASVEEGHEGTLPTEFSLVRVNKENIMVEVVKRAEDSDDIIVRLYECYNRRTKAVLCFSKEIARAWECNLMEIDQKEVEVSDNRLEFEIKPFEIKTFKLQFNCAGDGKA